MFGLIEMVPAPRESLFYRLAEKLRGREIQATEERLMGARILRLRISVPQKNSRKVLRRRARKAAAVLARRGINKAVFPEQFPFLQEFETNGIKPVATLPLFLDMAAELVSRGMKEKKLNPAHAMVAVTGYRVTRPARKALLEISQRVRYVAISAQYGAEEICRTLRQEYGVSVIHQPTRQQLASADVLLLFSEPEIGSCTQSVVIPLFEGTLSNTGENVMRRVLFNMPQALWGKVSEDCDRAQILAALLQAGTLNTENIEIAGIIWANEKQGT